MGRVKRLNDEKNNEMRSTELRDISNAKQKEGPTSERQERSGRLTIGKVQQRLSMHECLSLGSIYAKEFYVICVMELH